MGDIFKPNTKKPWSLMTAKTNMNAEYKCNSCEALKFDPLGRCEICEESFCDDCIENGVCTTCAMEAL